MRRYDAPEVNVREILRYAGCRGEAQDVQALAQECIAEAIPVLKYAVCWAEFALPERIESCDLRKNLGGCKRAVVFAATVGLGIDRLIAKYSRISPARAVVMQAVGAERIESLCDAFERDIRDQAAERGLRLRPRFSPGYGDLPLSAQRQIFAALDCARLIGISLNESLLMSPSKSVTAIIGLSEDGEACCGTGCIGCDMTDCGYRRQAKPD